MLLQEQMEKFIIEVFNYYNGKINVFNYPAILKIDWVMYNEYQNAFGYHTAPNVVWINAGIILNYYDNEFEFAKYEVIETIIHELFHLDQNVNNQLYLRDILYHDKIEKACIAMTSSYIITNTISIDNIFGVDFNSIQFIENVLKDNQLHYMYLYERVKWADYVMNIIYDMLNGLEYPQDLYNKLNTNLRCSIGTIIFSINGEEILIQENFYKAPIFLMSDFMYKNYFINMARMIEPTITIRNEGVIIIEIKMQACNELCTIREDITNE